MRRDEFYYPLPEALIAQQPLPERAASRLLCLAGDSGQIVDRQFRDLPALLEAGDLLVFNDTRVLRARLLGRKASGGRVEVLVERVLDSARLLAQIRASKSPVTGGTLEIAADASLEILTRRNEFYELKVWGGLSVDDLLAAHGRMPLPPYIDRAPTPHDEERYQTVYARNAGAVAAPTAGLHFDNAMLEKLRSTGVTIGYVTLHVGAGTFQPLRVDEVESHRMHAERYVVPAALCAQVTEARRCGHRVIAVGTTVVRALESAYGADGLVPHEGETDIFIYPGYRFNCVDALVTNFHLPESTLLMLVCAFAGKEPVLAAYAHAVAQGYRFFSYGDAMWVTRREV